MECNRGRNQASVRLAFKNGFVFLVDLQMYHFLRGYRRDLLQSRPDHVELIVEKLTVQNIIETVANRYTLPMTIRARLLLHQSAI